MKQVLVGSLLLSALLVAGCTQTHTHNVSDNISSTGVEGDEPKPNAPITADTHFAAGQVAESPR